MIWGNIIGILLCLLQAHFKLIKLDPDVYYIPAVPIELNFGYILILNISCLVISLLMLIGPSYDLFTIFIVDHTTGKID